MITLKDLQRCINQKILEAFSVDGVDIPIIANDVQEPISRPCLRVRLEDSKFSKEGVFMRRCNTTLKVYFYPKDNKRYRSEHFAMGARLTDIFLEDIVVDGFYIPANDGIEIEDVDDILVASLELDFIEVHTEEDGELVENLKFQV